MSTRLTRQLAPAALIAWVGAGCAQVAQVEESGGSPLDVSSSPVVYGTDSRLEFFEAPSEELRRLAGASSLAVLRRSSLDGSGPDGVRVVAPSLGEARGLCETERFVEQPAAAVCSSVLVDDDLLLLAGHCIESERSCEDLLFVAGYYYDAPGELHPIGLDDVFACRRLALWRPAGEGSDEALDVAFVQLDRPVRAPLAPAVLAPRAPLPDDAVTAIGHGDGLPGKIDAEGRWLGPCASGGPCGEAQIDTFAGSSGGGVFDARRELAGIVVSGRQDHALSEQGCLTVRTELASAPHGEGILLAQPAVEALCLGGWPSQRLCGAPGACGDAICALGEDESTCPADCRAAECGDGRCEAAEWRACGADCPATAPAHWMCPSLWYGEGGRCDCACGAPDPDCLWSDCDPEDGSAPVEPVAPGAPPGDAGACSLPGPQRSHRGAALAAGLLVFLAGLAALTRRRRDRVAR
ncbi:trypsin-like serine peptidase [Sorangium sp. So ce1099]|uniref:trypsin-like serine peptidase n=1 Tax=Sorangium sp. So ce1099 TaxID=3133331 RepID=UPI003F614474